MEIEKSTFYLDWILIKKNILFRLNIRSWWGKQKQIKGGLNKLLFPNQPFFYHNANYNQIFIYSS